MAQLSNSTDLQTDAYPSAQPRPIVKSVIDLNKDQKKVLGVSAAALLLGGAAWTVAQKITEQKDRESDGAKDKESALPAPTPVNLPADIDVAGKVTDSMSFEQAFAAARDEVGMGGVFGWHGRWYNTFLKEEWRELSVQQRVDFTEMVTQEHLGVKPYEQHVTTITQPAQHEPVDPEPTVIEGHINGQRVMGLDFDQDGIIDTLVMDAADGYTYRVVDATGDQGLDTLYKYDSLDGEWMMIEKMEHPFVLSNDRFSQGLEESMSREVVDSILEADDVAPDTSATAPEINDDTPLSDDTDNTYLADAYKPDDDTYVNNGDVHDMDE